MCKKQNNYQLLRMCDKCEWKGCATCVSECHKKLTFGCDGSTKPNNLEMRGTYKYPCLCLIDGSIQTDDVDKVEGNSPIPKQSVLLEQLAH